MNTRVSVIVSAVWCCRYDGTVRNSAGDVVQFLYGEDGMDAVRIEGQVRCGAVVCAFSVLCNTAGLFGNSCMWCSVPAVVWQVAVATACICTEV
jgi:hypothetical protein